MKHYRNNTQNNVVRENNKRRGIKASTLLQTIEKTELNFLGLSLEKHESKNKRQEKRRETNKEMGKGHRKLTWSKRKEVWKNGRRSYGSSDEGSRSDFLAKSNDDDG